MATSLAFWLDSPAFLKSCALVQSGFRAFQQGDQQLVHVLDEGTVSEPELMRIEQQASGVTLATQELFQERKNPIIKNAVVENSKMANPATTTFLLSARKLKISADKTKSTTSRCN